MNLAQKSSQRTPAGHIPSLPGALPNAHIPEQVDAVAISEECLKYLNSLQEYYLTDDALWRDLFALTGTLRTFYRGKTVTKAWSHLSKSMRPHSFTLVPESCKVMRVGDVSVHSWIVAMFTFEMESEIPSTCSGFVHLVPHNGGWKIWVIRTILEGFKGCMNVDRLSPVHEQGTGEGLECINGQEVLDAIVVGSGPHGLCTSGRLKAAGLTYLMVEKNHRVGDSWGTRYDSARLHTPREYAHLPFERSFSSEDEQFLGKDTLGNAYENWVRRFGINHWTSSTVKSATWNGQDKVWNVQIDREGNIKTLATRNIVLAIGIGGQFPKSPQVSNQHLFKGRAMHSAEYTGPKNWSGKKGVVVGTANTAHDIAEDMLSANCSSVTMVQRGHTYVIPRECLVAAYQPMYRPEIPTELGDRISQTNPLSITRELANLAHHKLIKERSELYDGLEKAGFKLERYGDMNYNLYSRLGGHYIDIGTSQKIADGTIKIKSNASLTSFFHNGLLFEDGSKLEADVVVFATGFDLDMRGLVANIVGGDVADCMDDFWGVNDEGEIRGAWRPSGHPGLFYTGGTLGQSRMMTRFIALQIQADRLGHPLEPYEISPED